MQMAITLAIIGLATGYTVYATIGVFLPARKDRQCGGGCHGCAASKRKGEPVELVPLKSFLEH
jgi:hypothetical protein